MIAVDTSAVVAVLEGEAGSRELEERLVGSTCLMSAVTRVELGIVVEARTGPAGAQLLEELLERIGVRVVPVDEATVGEALVAWRRFGKGRHRAGLDLGDVFSYALARRHGCPLLFVGDDFTHTDVSAA